VIVHISKAGQIREAKEASAEDLFTYVADVQKVINGDTIWVKINLGFGFSVRSCMRLVSQNLNRLLLEKGLARLMSDIPENVWTEENMGRF
jgi:endonuclease YncB( thermonuclease family)